MNEIIRVEKTTINNQIVPTVNARDLHNKLESKQQFADWIKNRIDKYGFIEGEDFIIIEEMALNKYHKNTTPNLSQSMNGAKEYILKIDVAKEIAMVENNEKGKQLRKYFIEVEKNYKEVKPMTIEQLLEYNTQVVKQLREENLQLTEKIEETKPLVDFARTIGESADAILVREFTKLINSEGIDIGEKRLFKWFRDGGYLNSKNEPYQTFKKYFNVIERPVVTIKGTLLVPTTKINGLGQVYFLEKLKKELIVQ